MTQSIERKQRLYDDVAVGDAITPLVKHPTEMQLAKWAGASGDFAPLHYDKDYATKEAGLPGVLVHGPLKSAFLIQMLIDWAGGDVGAVKKFRARFVIMDLPNKPLTCKGAVTAKRIEGSVGLADCDIWIENADGQKTVLASGVVALPLHAGDPVAH